MSSASFVFDEVDPELLPDSGSGPSSTPSVTEFTLPSGELNFNAYVTVPSPVHQIGDDDVVDSMVLSQESENDKNAVNILVLAVNELANIF